MTTVIGNTTSQELSCNPTTSSIEREESTCLREISPIKMDQCLFSFPIPTAMRAPLKAHLTKTWTITMEPLTNTPITSRSTPSCAGVSTPFHLKPLLPRKISNLRGIGNVSRNSSPSWGSSIEPSPKKKRKSRIYLNGTCIDNGEGAPPISKRKRCDLTGTGRQVRTHNRPKTFTFVTEKREIVHQDPALSSKSAMQDDLSSSFSSKTMFPSRVVPAGGKKKGERKPRKRFLTFHQLEFDRETLKPFDRTIFVSKRPIASLLPSEMESEFNRKNNERRLREALIAPPCQSMVNDAAEMLLELRTHPSSEYYYSSFENEVVQSSNSYTVTVEAALKVPAAV